MSKVFDTLRNLLLPAVLHSYTVIFFINNKSLAVLLLLVSFINFYAGISGLIAVIFAVAIAYYMGFDKQQLKQGLLSFNALLIGLGMGTFFDQSLVFYSMLLIVTLLTLILSITLGGWLGKYGLPVLSIPFVLAFWFIALPSDQFENLGLTHRNIFWTNEVYAVGGNFLLNLYQYIDNFPINALLNTYLRSLSSIFFQENLITGFIIALVLLIGSRIIFTLSIIGFFSAYFFAEFTGSGAASMTYYNIGANYMMVAIAIGGFFLIPSKHSYFWSILLIPLTTLVLLFVNKLFGYVQLPIFSLPFSIVVILFVYFLKLRVKPSNLIITPVQFFSPETNLYTYNNNKSRLAHLMYYPLYLPFWGEWTVSQGHNGKYTHKGDWGHAFDFIIMDDEKKSYTQGGHICENYYCYNKPILAPADGIVEDIYDNIDDNEISKVDTENNWGNTIIIKHLTGLYTQLSHLKKGSFKVNKGSFVRKGDVIALCGNSGRSPEPHLHFQVQNSPILGSKSIDYPLSYYSSTHDNDTVLRQFHKPNEGDIVSGIEENETLKKAFELLPNSTFKLKYTDSKGELLFENWESFTDANNQKYLYCSETEATAYYVNDNSMFYFTTFYGNKKSLLYYFYLSAYKIFLSDFDNGTISDAMPLNISNKNKIVVWLNDFSASFYSFLKLNYQSSTKLNNNLLDNRQIEIASSIEISYLGKKQIESASTIQLLDAKLNGFTFQSSKIKIAAVCINT